MIEPVAQDSGGSFGRAAAAVSLLVSLLAWLPVFAAEHCVVLQYHHFSDDTPAITSVTPEQFQAHLEYLESAKFSVLPLRQVVTSLRQKLELPDRCVSLTVDDAYLSVYQNAMPALIQRKWPLTVPGGAPRTAT